MQEKIHSSELISLVYFIMRSSYIGIAINSYLYFGKIDSYISIILGIILGYIPLILILKISDINKEKNINEILIQILGEKLGKIIIIILSIFIFAFASFIFYDLINFISSEYLYKTPSILTGIMMLIPILYTVNKGIKTICRTSIILFILSIILYIISFFGLIPSFDFENLLPFMQTNKINLFLAVFSYIAYAILPLMLLLIIPKNNLPKNKSNKIIFKTTFIVGIIIFLSLLNTIGVLGIDLSLLYQYPDYQVLRRIQIGGFIQRTESILAIQWFLCLFIMIVLCMYYIIKTKENIKIKISNKILLIMLSITLIFINEKFWNNNTSFIAFSIIKIPILIYIFILIPLLILYITYLIKKKCS